MSKALGRGIAEILKDLEGQNVGRKKLIKKNNRLLSEMGKNILEIETKKYKLPLLLKLAGFIFPKIKKWHRDRFDKKIDYCLKKAKKRIKKRLRLLQNI